MTARVAAPRAPERVAAVDASRAVALVAMIAYHFTFDLRYRGVIDADFEHAPVWLVIRTLILSAFLVLAGVSLVLAERSAVARGRFWRNVGMIAACAMLVSAGSYALFPQSYIWFGVLHLIAVALILARPLARHPRIALAIGLTIMAAGLAWSNPIFDRRALGWLGFMTAKPYTEDYVPLFPYAGIVFLGIPAGHALVNSGFAILRPLANAPQWFVLLGRHTLFIYMVHQPLLLGALWLVLRR